MNKAMASLFLSSEGEINGSLKRGPVCSLNLKKGMILMTQFFCSLLVGSSIGSVLICKASRHPN